MNDQGSIYQALVEQSPVAIAVHEIIRDDQGVPVDYRFLAANTAFGKHTGLDSARIIGRTVREILPGIEETDYISRYGNVVDSGSPLNFESYSPPLKRHYKTDAFKVGDNAFATIFTDITQTKIYERELIQFKLIFDQADLGMAVCDLGGVLTYVNQAMAEMHGYAPAECVGQSIQVFHNEQQRPIVERLFGQTKHSGGFQAVEAPHAHRDGHTFDLLMTVQSLRDGKGMPYAHAATAMDISDVRQAEQALRESNERLKAFLQVSQAITAYSDINELMQTIVDQSIKVMRLDSAAVYVKTGPATIRLAATTPALPPDFPETARCAALNDHPHIEKAMEKRRYCIMADTKTATLAPAEKEIVRLRNLRSNLYLPICLRDESIGILIVSATENVHTFGEEDISFLQGFADHAAQMINNIQNYERVNTHAAELEQSIAERERAEAEKDQINTQFQQAQKMESVGRLAGGVAHDYNNMLQVILGSAELALSEYEPEEAVRVELEEIRLSAARSQEITRQLLAFARKQAIRPKALDLNATIESTLKMLRRLIGENIRLTWQPGSGVWPVFMDPGQVDQVLANLCVNARDAIGETGQVTITTHTARISLPTRVAGGFLPPGDYTRLDVSDTGHGIDPGNVANIFEPFFTTKPAGQGTGLGLSTIYGIATQNQGGIDVKNEPGKGATFQLYFPRHRGPVENGAVTESRDSIPRGEETVLIVEDEGAVLRQAARSLERQGYRVWQARTGAEALDHVRSGEGPVHLLLTDVVMPDMNGRALAEQLAAIIPDLKCLYMSGYTADVIGRQGVLEKDVQFIQKPFSIRDLARTVRRVLDGPSSRGKEGSR